MKRRYNIILIDDDVNYCEELRREANSNKIKIVHYQNLADGMDAIENANKFKAIVLDGRCTLNANQKPETAKSSFVFHAINRLNELEHEFNRFVPFCVNSETPQDFTEDLYGICPVFEKRKTHREMFKFLREQINAQPYMQIRREHDDIFDFVDDFLSEEDEDLLLDVLANADNGDPATIVANLSIMRRLEEALVDAIALNFMGQSASNIGHRNMSRTKNTEIMCLLVKTQNIYPQVTQYAHWFMG